MNKSPFTVDDIFFCAYQKDNSAVDLSALPFDARRDFIINKNFGGIAVKIYLSVNYACHEDAPFASNITYTLVDNTTRLERDIQYTRVSKDNDNHDYFTSYILFDESDVQFIAGHTYKLVIHDDSTAITLGEYAFHLFSEQQLGHPSKWYCVVDGAIRPAWEHKLYKSLSTVHFHDYYVRFNICQMFGQNPPVILPELEVRLYHTDSNDIESRYTAPICVDFASNSYFVEMLFTTTPYTDDFMYAELRCMGYPIGGFISGIRREAEKGQWWGYDILPLDEYSPEAVQERIDKHFPQSSGDTE